MAGDESRPRALVGVASTPDWARAALPYLLLTILRAGPSYGYAISASLARSGFTTVKGAAIYPLLGRLESAGLLTTHWQPGDGGPGRKFFTLTASGERERRRIADEWQRFAATVDRLTTENGGPR